VFTLSAILSAVLFGVIGLVGWSAGPEGLFALLAIVVLGAVYGFGRLRRAERSAWKFLHDLDWGGDIEHNILRAQKADIASSGFVGWFDGLTADFFSLVQLRALLAAITRHYPLAFE
jgi:hypothetical protein